MSKQDASTPGTPAPTCQERLARLLDGSGLPPSTASAVLALFAECEARHAEERRRKCEIFAHVKHQRDEAERLCRTLQRVADEANAVAERCNEQANVLADEVRRAWAMFHAADAEAQWWQDFCTGKIPVLEAFRFLEALGPRPARKGLLGPEAVFDGRHWRT